MSPEQVEQIRAAWPWLPADYLRLLGKLPAGARRYGVHWLDGPQIPGEAWGKAVGQAYASVLWIGRRAGNPVGYRRPGVLPPRIEVWGGSQQEVLQVYSGIDALVLSQIPPDADLRPVVAHALSIPGVSFARWHDVGYGLSALCMFSPGLEALGVDHLLAQLAPGWSLTLTCEDNDSWFGVEKDADGYTTCLSRHGSVGETLRPPVEEIRRQMLALAPFNGGSWGGYFARLTIPGPTAPPPGPTPPSRSS